MSAYHEIRLYDTTGKQRAVLEGWHYLMYTQQLNAPWYHEIHIRLAYNDERAYFLREEVDADWIVEVYRYDHDGTPYLVYEGFNRTIYEQNTADGYIIFNLYGSGYTELLARRIVVPPSGQENLSLSGAGETVMKQFVDSQCVNPEDPSRVIPGLSIETSAGRGLYAEYTARYTKLTTVLENVAKQARLDFGIVGTGTAGRFEFQCRPLWGIDRRYRNPLDYPPTIFDITLNNMNLAIFTRNSSEERNTIYVGGQGQGTERQIIIAKRDIAVNLSPWNRREGWVDARHTDSEDELEAVAQEQLDKYAYRAILSFTILESEGTRWMHDWALGDIVTARYYGYETDKKIVQIEVTVSSNETGAIEYIKVDMEDAPREWTLGYPHFSELGVTTVLA